MYVIYRYILNMNYDYVYSVSDVVTTKKLQIYSFERANASQGLFGETDQANRVSGIVRV